MPLRSDKFRGIDFERRFRECERSVANINNVSNLSMSDVRSPLLMRWRPEGHVAIGELADIDETERLLGELRRAARGNASVDGCRAAAAGGESGVRATESGSMWSSVHCEQRRVTNDLRFDEPH